MCLSIGGVPGPEGSSPGGAWSWGCLLWGVPGTGRGSAPRGVPVPGGAWSGGCLVPGGCLLQGGAWSGVPGPRGCLVLGGGIPGCTEADLPRERWLLLRTVCILLECILVSECDCIFYIDWNGLYACQ